MTTNKNYRIKNIITYIFVSATVITMVAAIISVLLLNQHEIKVIRENNLVKTHDLLSHLIAPAVEISDGTSIIRQLSLASDDNQFYVVIDNNADIFSPNAEDMQLVQNYFGNKIKGLTCNNDETLYKQINGVNYWVKCSNLVSADLTSSKSYMGVLVSFSKNILLPTFSLSIYSLGIAMLTLFLIGFLFRSFLNKYLLIPLVQLTKYIQSSESDSKREEMQYHNFSHMPLEIKVIKETFEKLLSNLDAENNKRIEYEKRGALFEMAAQVAHDMRSPLLAVDQFFHLIEKKLDESERVFGKRAMRRLDDIAWSLLSKYKHKEDAKNTNGYVFLYSSLLELAAEKRMEYSKHNVEFEVKVNSEDAFSLIFINPVPLKRMFSNIINNAVNAILPGSGLIEVSIEGNIAGLLITIRDNGKGMSPEVLNEIISNARSEKAKTNLGLPHAIHFLDEIGGDFNMTSVEGEGTVVRISLPFSETPSWCLNEYHVHEDDLLVIIDDSQSVHDVWDEMFKKIPDAQYKHLYTPDEALNFFKETTHQNLIIFCDYEFFEADKNGFDVLDQAPVGSLRVTVTSHLYDPILMQGAIDKGFKLLPKDLVSHFKLKKLVSDDSEGKTSLIFIDDDRRNTESWEFFAKVKKLNISTYNDLDSFFRDAPDLDKAIPVYIDLHLNAEKDGIAYAKEIKAFGFEKIYIATGIIDSHLKGVEYPWVTEIIEKRFPFL